MRQPDDFPDEELPAALTPNLPGDEANDEWLASPALLDAGLPDDLEPDDLEPDDLEPDDESFDGAGTGAAIDAAAAVMAGTGAAKTTLAVTSLAVTSLTVTEQSVTVQTGREVTGTEVQTVAVTLADTGATVGEAAPRPVVPAWVRKAYADKLLAYSAAPSYADYVARSRWLRQLLHSRYAETRLLPAAQQAANAFPETLNILAVIAEEDPDTIAVLPIVARLVDAGPRLQLRVLSDEGDLFALSVLAPELDLNALLEEWDLPQFLLFDEEWELQAQWGPRPSAAEPQVEAWLAAHPEYEALAEDESVAGQERYAALTQRLMYEMRVWYNSSLAKSCLEEWQALLTAWQNGEDATVEGVVEGEA